jgi:hypothetical protein
VRNQIKKQLPGREELPDGSALVTFPDGSMLIVESKLAKSMALRQSRPANYDEPPPPPPGQP